jgi:hypothetical protein
MPSPILGPPEFGPASIPALNFGTWPMSNQQAVFFFFFFCHTHSAEIQSEKVYSKSYKKELYR